MDDHECGEVSESFGVQLLPGVSQMGKKSPLLDIWRIKAPRITPFPPVNRAWPVALNEGQGQPEKMEPEPFSPAGTWKHKLAWIFLVVDQNRRVKIKFTSHYRKNTRTIYEDGHQSDSRQQGTSPDGQHPEQKDKHKGSAR